MTTTRDIMWRSEEWMLRSEIKPTIVYGGGDRGGAASAGTSPRPAGVPKEIWQACDRLV
jgi:hypothetical protein